MKLCWIHPTTASDALAPLWQKLDAAVRPALHQGTELEFRFLPRSGNFVRSAYAEHINSVHIVEAALKAEADGFDGIFLGCWNDPLWEAREVLSVPVGSVSEQSMLAALAMGKRLAVVTVSQKTTVAIENDLLAYGLRDRAIVRPVRTILPESDADLLLGAVSDPYAAFIPRVEEVAKTCIADGADVILVGCAYYGPLLRMAGYTEVPGTGVPVVDSSTVALKYLEAMTDIAMKLGTVKSTRLQLRPPPRESLDMARRSLSLI
ncbi:aspartate/glutamate racemase family protein [Ancylobacter rudongensis]|uniref:Allantoin racemase n=1 Tax=Ancylobacter rudongensis TaxID=177413 RepID=A0A1G4SES3_9HYPH|nr:aspartate/glutamate racemase family protein [Ancylobacter rudongensis]SCW67075.1 allantoin racemase [Ancylobacter rudongensis]